MANSRPNGKIPLRYQSTTNGWETLYVFPINPNSIVKLIVDITASETGGANRASFTRIGSYFRQGGASQITQMWHTIFTEKTQAGFDIRHVLGADKVTFQIKAPNNINTLWVGYIEIRALF